MSLVCDHLVRVRYAETDQMGWVYASHYLTWFEVGRTELIRGAGTDYREIEGRGYLLPLVEATLRIRHGARYDDLLTVRTRLGPAASRRIVFEYEILRGGELLAVGTTTHLCAETATGRVVRIPGWIRGLLQAG